MRVEVFCVNPEEFTKLSPDDSLSVIFGNPLTGRPKIYKKHCDFILPTQDPILACAQTFREVNKSGPIRPLGLGDLCRIEGKVYCCGREGFSLVPNEVFAAALGA